MNNVDLLDMFRKSRYTSFVEFLDNEIEFVDEDSKEKTCEFCDVPCGNEWCVTKEKGSEPN
jgi:hypothetical protein